MTRNKGSDGCTEPTFEHDWIESSIGAINGTPKPTAVIIQLSAEFLACQQNVVVFCVGDIKQSPASIRTNRLNALIERQLFSEKWRHAAAFNNGCRQSDYRLVALDG
jgi:hypothetical protein